MTARSNLFGAAAGLVLFGAAGVAEAGSVAQFFFDAEQPYASFDDSPFQSLVGPGDPFWLEDFEDGLLDTPGVTASSGAVRVPGPSTDSVDDDGSGLRDGFGTDGYSYFTFTGEAPSITFTFDEESLGQLPTMAGLVWTDGNPEALFQFEAFDGKGDSLGMVETFLGDAWGSGTTDDDRFLGVLFEGGVSAITIRGAFGGLEIDHLQYGYAASVVPVPPAAGLGLVSLAVVAWRRRRKLA